MAGIAGIIIKDKNNRVIDYKAAFDRMMKKLAYSESQLKQCYQSNKLYFGNVIPISSHINDHFQVNAALKIYVVIDGLIFIDKEERKILSEHFNLTNSKSDYELIPFLYHLYREDFINHLTGWFNIFIYDENSGTAALINDRLGYLPLYYYESEYYFLFSSKIESILSTGLLPDLNFDPVTILEHLFFNYPISDNTYIKGIKTLSNAESIKINPLESSKRNKYWSIAALFELNSMNKDDSFDMMNNGLKSAIQKVTERYSTINLSLTGGWDSRVVLSYFLPEHSNKLNLYSFGAPNANDILIPKEIAEKEKLNYTGYVLDKNYLNNLFLLNAMDTIKLSNGTRNYKRTHYIYAIKQLAPISEIAVSGIFGDEVFKVAQSVGGTVLSINTIKFLESDLDIQKLIFSITDGKHPDLLNTSKNELLEEFSERLRVIKKYLQQYDTISKKYYSIRFEYNLRKYFGNEVNSYNDFVYCSSPFIDYDFLKTFAQTTHFGINLPFNSNSLRLKKKATELYYNLTKENYPALTPYNSSRGFSMKDSASIQGKLKIFYTKYLRQNTRIDEFNTKPTDVLFFNHINNIKTGDNHIIAKPELGLTFDNRADLYSLFYWTHIIEQQYT